MSQPCLHLDFETKSNVDIRKAGAFRYAEDPSTDILCAALALGDEEPVIWVNPLHAGQENEWGDRVYHTQPRALELMRLMAHPDTIVHAHNAQFEAAITHYQGARHGFKIHSLANWRCSAAMCRRANIQASLEKAALTLGISQQKDKKGSSLIQKFSVPSKKTGLFGDPVVHAREFNQFIEYCKQDVRVEQEIEKVLHQAFRLSGPVLETFLLDLRINMRGLTVNVDALRHADKIIDAKNEELVAQFQEITGFMPSQNKVLLPWLQERGYRGANLQAITLDEELEDEDFDPDTDVGRALSLKRLLGNTSLAKVKAMLRCVCSDGRVRGSLQYYGAQTTGRWAGRLIQPQNFKRPDQALVKNMPLKELGFKNEGKAINWLTSSAYADICAGEPTENIEINYGPVLSVISSSIRHFIHPHSGMFFDLDFSNIEARIVCWLAGQEDALEKFRSKIDQYKELASVIFNKPIEQINDFPERFVGKQARLGCGFQMGPPKFRFTCKKYGYDLPYYVLDRHTGEKLLETINLDECKVLIRKLGKKNAKLSGLEYVAVKAFRETTKEVVKYWSISEAAAVSAIESPGMKFNAGKTEYLCAHTSGANYLFIKLPSGRRLSYRDPQIELVPMKKSLVDDCGDPLTREQLGDGLERDKEGKVRMRKRITYFGEIEGKGAFSRVDIYAGKFVENVTQAVAADIMAHGSVQAEKEGFEIATLIHDQCLAYTGTDMAENEKRLLVLNRCMTTMPAWADGLPIEVESKITPYYVK